MTKTRKTSVVFLSTVLALLAIAFMAVGVNAAPSHGIVAVHAHPNASYPTATIKGKKANYHPHKISVKVNGNPSFAIDNTESVAESLTYNGAVFYTIPAKTTQAFNCTQVGTFTIGLQSNLKAVLSIKCA